MPKLEIPDVPENLYRQIAELARQNGTSLEEEAAQILARGIPGGIATDDRAETLLLTEVRRTRQSLKDIYVTEEEIQAAKRRGRE
jgi:hypothetical protein